MDAETVWDPGHSQQSLCQDSFSFLQPPNPFPPPKKQFLCLEKKSQAKVLGT